MKHAKENPFPYEKMLIAIVSCVAIGCGQGASNSNSIPTKIPADGGTGSLADPILTLRNISDAAKSGFKGASNALTYAQIALDSTVTLLSSSVTTISKSCLANGSSEVQLVDNDRDGKVTAGDDVSLVWNECIVPLIDEPVTGTLKLRLTSTPTPGRQAGTISFVAGFLQQTGLGTPHAFFDGTLNISREIVGPKTSLFVAATARDDFVMRRADSNVAPKSERLRQLRVTKTIQLDHATVENTIALTLASEILKAEVAITTPEPLISHLDTFPHAGKISIRDDVGGSWHLLLEGEQGARSQMDVGALGLADAVLAFPSAQIGSLDSRIFATRWLDVGVGHIDRFLWWAIEPVQVSPYWELVRSFQVRAFKAKDFRLLSAPKQGSVMGVNETLVFQFSRELAVNTPPNFKFILSSKNPGSDSSALEVPAIFETNGAIVTVRPSVQLPHNWQCSLFAKLEENRDYGFLLGELAVRDRNGNATAMPSISMTTRANLSADAKVNGPALLLSGSTLTLDGRASVATDSNIVTYRWRQLDGTRLTLTGSENSVALVRIADVHSSTPELVHIELEVTNAVGEREVTQLTIHVFPPGTSPTVESARLRSSQGELTDWSPLTSAANAIGYAQLSADGSQLQFGLNAVGRPFNGLRTLSAAAGSRLTTGVFLVDSFLNSGPQLYVYGCGGSAFAGRVEVLEIIVDSANVVLNAALDFDVSCGSSDVRLVDSFRLNSNVPLTQ